MHARADSTALMVENYTVDDVQAAFANINVRGDYLAAWVNDAVPSPWYGTNFKNWFGFRNHFQGIQRLQNQNYVVISGSNTHQPMANLLIIKVASQPPIGDWQSNVEKDGAPPPLEDGVTLNFEIDSVKWHAGGMSTLGDLLVIPIYGHSPLHGKIIFYDMRTPESPRKLAVEIDRPGRKAYAVAVARLLNGFYIAAVLSGRDGLKKRLDFYLSKTEQLKDGFQADPVIWTAGKVEAANGQDKNFGDFQTINFIRQTDGRLFLAGFHNTAFNLRIIPGKDYADLFEIVLPPETTQSSDAFLKLPRVVKVANRQFYCKDGYCNMDAAGGIYVSPEGALSVYAATFWLAKDLVKFKSFPAMKTP